MLRIGVLASHQGTNFQAILDACDTGAIEGKVAILISNNSKAPVLARADAAGVATTHLSAATHPRPEKLDAAILKALRQAEVNLVVLAGYMKKLGARTLAAYQDRLINVHPSLLPRHGGQGMYGMKVHEAVIKHGDKETGATVHQVVSEYDTGAIVLQGRIPVLASDTPDTLAARVLKVEHDILITAINVTSLHGFMPSDSLMQSAHLMQPDTLTQSAHQTA